MLSDTTAQPTYELEKKDKRFVGWHILIAVAALTLGTQFGPLQALEHAGYDLYPSMDWLVSSYYQGLTIHGVLNALVWTTFFITGFLTLVMIKGLDRPLSHPMVNRIGFWTMVVGLLITAVPLLTDQATVLYTFYPPMQASSLFYLGLTLIVVGSWIEGLGFYLMFGRWRKENPDTRSPFVAFAALVTMVLWQVSTLGVAAEILGMLLPWSLGWFTGVDPQLSRTLFWFTGHPLVYFWLLPAYLSWYAMLPKEAGGKMFSDSLARLAFWLFLALSTPLGFHHQFVDPGIPAGWKYIHALLTYGVAFPSFLTLFTVVASLEYAGRKRGGKGLFGWIFALPWGKPSVLAQLLAGILFIFGGIGGIMNASYDMNLALHNTSWVPGHFHLTVASAATMTYIGISYWLVPYITGRQLWQPKLALWSSWIYFGGMLVFSNAMHTVGLLGAPRRVPLGLAPYVPAEWSGHLWRVGFGGTIMYIGIMLYVVVMIMTVVAGKRFGEGEGVEVPIAESLRDPQLTPLWLDRWKPWLIAVVVLIVLAYGPQLFEQISQAQMTSPGFTP
ncbi:MAG: b(o/a)3-type cytochrome-c oxidase subunit 1 [Actinomycetota bacterium]